MIFSEKVTEKSAEVNYVRKQLDMSVKRSASSEEKRTLLTGNKKDIVYFVTDKTGSLAYCHVPKAASTTWMLLFSRMNQLTPNETELQELYNS